MRHEDVIRAIEMIDAALTSASEQMEDWVDGKLLVPLTAPEIVTIRLALMHYRYQIRMQSGDILALPPYPIRKPQSEALHVRGLRTIRGTITRLVSWLRAHI